jgi:hypothetical protein
MNQTAVTREMLRLGALLFALLLVYSILRTTGLYQLTGHETEGLNTLILLIGSIYAVILAFAIFVIWGQFTEVENCVMRECNSLNDLLRYSEYVTAELGREIRKAIESYAQWVVKHEWQALGQGRRDKRADDLFSELVTTVIAWDLVIPSDSREHPFHNRLVDIARTAGERRGERVTQSITRIPPTLFAFVNIIAGVLLLLVFVYPFHQTAVGASCIALVTVILFLANFVMRDMDNPLEGAWNISPKPFSELKY